MEQYGAHRYTVWAVRTSEETVALYCDNHMEHTECVSRMWSFNVFKAGGIYNNYQELKG
jgi:hypothetical protein